VLGQPGLQALHPRVQGGRLLQRAQLAHVFRGVEEEPAGTEVRDAAGMHPGWQASGGRTCHGGGLQPDSEVCWEAACRIPGGASQAICQPHPATSAGLGLTCWPGLWQLPWAHQSQSLPGSSRRLRASLPSPAHHRGRERGAQGEAGIRRGALACLRACGRSSSAGRKQAATAQAGRQGRQAGGGPHLLAKHATEGVCHLCQGDVLPSHGHALIAIMLRPCGNDCCRHGADVVGGAPGQLRAGQPGRGEVRSEEGCLGPAAVGRSQGQGICSPTHPPTHPPTHLGLADRQEERIGAAGLLARLHAAAGKKVLEKDRGDERGAAPGQLRAGGSDQAAGV
jgi:hypothetical protein